MSSIAIDRVNVTKRSAEKKSLAARIGRYITETAEVVAPGVFAMNNSYYRPAK